MIKQILRPVLLVGHSYGGAVITEAGNLPNVIGLVYIAAHPPEVGESLGSLSGAERSAAIANLVPDLTTTSGSSRGRSADLAAGS